MHLKIMCTRMADDYSEFLKFDTLARSTARFASKFLRTFRDCSFHPNRVLSNRHNYTEPLTFLAVGWLLTRAGIVLISATSPIQFGGVPTRLSEIGLSPQTPVAALAAVLPVALAMIFGANVLSRIMRGNPTPDTAVAAACYPLPTYLTWLTLVYALITMRLADIENHPDESLQQAGVGLIVGVMIGLAWCVVSIVSGMLHTTAPIQRRWKRWGRAVGVAVLSLFLLQGTFSASRLADSLVGRPSPLISAGSSVRLTPLMGDGGLQPFFSELWQLRLHLDNQTGRPIAVERDSCKPLGSEIQHFEVKQWSAGDATRLVMQPDERGWLDVDVVVRDRRPRSNHGPEYLVLLCEMGQKKELYGLELVNFALAGLEDLERNTP